MDVFADWNLVRSFLAVVRAGSLSGAARQLGATQPTVGRHVDTLEEGLGFALFTRSPTGLMPTESALALVPMAEAMEASAHALVRAASAAAGPERGTVRITAAEVMGAEVLPPILADFRAAHPGITLELVLSNRSQDLLRRDADIAVRAYRPTQAALAARHVGTSALGFHAAESYLARHGRPLDWGDLQRFHLIGFDRDDTSVRAVTVPIQITRDLFTFRCDSDLAQWAALRAGLGIGVCQLGLAARHPHLVRVLPQVDMRVEIWLAMHEDLRSSRPVRLAYDALAAGLRRYLHVR